MVKIEGEDFVAVEDLDGKGLPGDDVASVLHLPEVALPDRLPDLILFQH